MQPPAILAVLLTVVAGGCSRPLPLSPPGPAVGCEEIDAFVNGDLASYENGVEAALTRALSAEWAKSIGVVPVPAVAAFWKVETRIENDSALLARSDDLAARIPVAPCPAVARFSRARALLQQAITPVGDAALRHSIIEMEAELSAKNNAFRISLDGERITPQELWKRLAREADPAKRKRIYEAGATARSAAWLDWGYLKLVRLRNELARASGAADYDAYGFRKQGIDRDRFFEQLAEVKRQLAGPYRDALNDLAKAKGIDPAQPWNLPYLEARLGRGDLDTIAGRILPERVIDVARAFYREMGISVPDKSIALDLLPRSGKNGHAGAFIFRWPGAPPLDSPASPTPPADLALFLNITAPVQWNDVDLAIHELGHCVHALNIHATTPFFRRYEPLAAEALGMSLQRLSTTRAFLTSYSLRAAVGDSVSGELAHKAADIEKAERLRQARELLGVLRAVEAERSIYEDPGRDLWDLGRKLQAEYSFSVVPSTRVAWEGQHFLLSPVYVQNYALGMFLAESVAAEGSTTTLSSWEKRVLNYAAPGREFPLESLALRLVGQGIQPDAAAKLLGP
jgi:hypothetical protein